MDGIVEVLGVNTASMNEEQIIQAAQKGDIDAFNQLVVKYQQLAYNVAYRILGNPDRAADATQDGFLRGYRALYQFRGGSFKTWILRIVTNCCYDQLRVLKRRPSTPIDDILEDDEHSTLLKDRAESPEGHAERMELGDALQQSLEILPEEQRTVLVLYHYADMSHESIADAMGIAVGTARSRLHRAHEALRAALEADARPATPGHTTHEVAP